MNRNNHSHPHFQEGARAVVGVVTGDEILVSLMGEKWACLWEGRCERCSLRFRTDAGITGGSA